MCDNVGSLGTKMSKLDGPLGCVLSLAPCRFVCLGFMFLKNKEILILNNMEPVILSLNTS